MLDRIKRSLNLQRIPRASFCAVFLVLLPLAARIESSAGQAGKTLAEDLDGKALDPFSVSTGRAVVLLFVRIDCPISNRYAPLLQQLSQKFRGKADFWLVYPDREQTASQIRTHLRDFHYSLPALRDTHHALVKRSQATITPEAAVFDSSGRLVYHGRIDNGYEDFGRARPTATTHELDNAVTAAVDGRALTPNHASAVGCYISDRK